MRHPDLLYRAVLFYPQKATHLKIHAAVDRFGVCAVVDGGVPGHLVFRFRKDRHHRAGQRAVSVDDRDGDHDTAVADRNLFGLKRKDKGARAGDGDTGKADPRFGG